MLKKKSLQFVLLLSLLAPLAAHAEQEVKFTAEVTNFIVIPTAHGIVSKSRDGLALLLSTLTFTANAKVPTPVKVQKFRIGLASRTSDGRWNISHWSESAKLDVDIEPGKALTLKNIGGVVPIQGVASLDNRWLVIECYVTFQGKSLTTYAHSAPKLLDKQFD